MRRERHEQAFGTLKTSTLDALGNPLRIHPASPGREPAHCAGMRSAVSVVLFAVRSSNCLYDSSDQAMCFIEVGSCSLQEEQML